MSFEGPRGVDALLEIEWAKYQLGAVPVVDLPSVGVRLLQAAQKTSRSLSWLRCRRLLLGQ